MEASAATLRAASRLHERATALDVRAARLLTHSPDTGTDLADDAVLEVQSAAVQALREAADDLTRIVDDLQAPGTQAPGTRAPGT